jgi:hypothetical protein
MPSPLTSVLPLIAAAVLLFPPVPAAPPAVLGQPGRDVEQRPLAGSSVDAVSTPAPPGCWIRGEREDLELRISRLDSASVELDGETVKVCYSRPRKLGRPIMGRLVPFGEPWRLGANEATVLHLPVAATVAGVPVEAGSYSLYAVPGEASWRIVVNADARRWGIPIDEEVRREDVGSGTVPAETLGETVERLTLRLLRRSPDRAVLRIEWERTGVDVTIELRPDPGEREGGSGVESGGRRR